MGDLTIITNNVPRDIICGYELTDTERAEFDYLDWAAIDEGCDSASFVRYRGELIDLGTVQRTSGSGDLAGWSGISPDSAFSGILTRWAVDKDAYRPHGGIAYRSDVIIVGRYHC